MCASQRRQEDKDRLRQISGTQQVPGFFTVIGFLPSKKVDKDLELDLASGFGHASGWNAQWFTRKVEYVADNNELKSLWIADKP